MWLLRMFGATIGKGCSIEPGVRVWQPWNLSIGDNSWVGGRAILYSVDKINIGSNCVVSDGAFLCTASHDIKSRCFELKTAPIEVGSSVWIAARAVVLPGRKIGNGAVVGCSAVVMSDVEPWNVVVGNPAVARGTRVICD